MVLCSLVPMQREMYKSFVNSKQVCMQLSSSEGKLSPSSFGFINQIKKLYNRECVNVLHRLRRVKTYSKSSSAGIYLLRVNNRNTRTRCEISLKLTVKTPERRHWGHSGVCIVNFQQVSHIVLMFLMLTLSK